MNNTSEVLHLNRGSEIEHRTRKNNMSNQVAARTREKWVDDVKVIACILVVVGHFFQSMVMANILPDSDLYELFITTIYYFHVPLFFICSGYLYQKYSKVNSVISWRRNVVKKALALGMPYVTFSTATWILKKAFSGSVNSQLGGLGDTLLFHPALSYWYLYALFFVFLLTPTFESVKMAIGGLVVAIVMKTIALNGRGDSVYAVSTILSNEIWFILGMSISVFNVQLKARRVQGTVCGLLFMILSVMVYKAEINGGVISFAMGLLACVAVILMTMGAEGGFGRGVDFLAKYTMPIFLMHTLFAAALRSVLMKIGIENAVIHVVLGLGISFIGPIIAAWIMKKTKWLEFFLYPNKFVKIRN